jgi:hydrogenase expression/formation protein HypE
MSHATIDTPPGAPSCPTPIGEYPHVLLAHGGGGRLMRDLIEQMFLPAFDSPRLARRHDGAVCEIGGARLAFTTDSFVVRPLFFPGGDIGTLAVNGTVNDIAMCGARPLYLSVGLILEEGLPMKTLWRVVRSMRDAASLAGVELVTGDTKVVDRGKADGLFINTSGVGALGEGVSIGPDAVRPGDAIVLSGDIGRHGVAVMAVREGLTFETAIVSDCAPLAAPALGLLEQRLGVHCMRDLTRGGLASALVEIADVARHHVALDESAVPVDEEVEAACEILGLDPLYVANEGRFVVFVAPADAEAALAVLRAHPCGANAAIIGRVAEERAGGLVTMRTKIGADRVIDALSGEQLPRIC